jgi:hypothetical protein
MRTFLFAFSASLAVAAPAAAANRNFGVTSFTKVRVEGPFTVKLATDVAPFASATGSSEALDRVDVEVNGDTLVVRPSASSSDGYPGSDPGPVEVSLGTHDLTNAWLIGAGTLTIDRVRGLSFALSVQGPGRGVIGAVASDQMSVSVVGSGSARLTGRTKKLTALARGIASVDAADLVASDAVIGAEGTSTIDANIADTATVDTSGPATIRLTGRPSCTLKVAGSTTVSGCK